MIGFMPTLSDYLVVSSSGESRSDLFLNEGAEEMNEVTVVVTHSRNNTQNIMSLAGGRTLSIEEANRFAGNFDDPTRLASSFAGVTTGSVNSNAMEVREMHLSSHNGEWKVSRRLIYLTMQICQDLEEVY